MISKEAQFNFGIIGIMSKMRNINMEPNLEKIAAFWPQLILPMAITGVMGVPLVKALIQKKISDARQEAQKETLDEVLPYVAAVNAPSGLLGVDPRHRPTGLG